MEVEEIILNKEYFELSAKEKAMVAELAENEQAYNDLKWFLASTHEAAAANKIEASENLSKSVFAHLEEPAGKRIWLNGGSGAAVGAPKRKIYQMPAFQVGIAACIVAGFFLFANPFGKDANQLALNDIDGKETEIIDEEGYRTENEELLKEEDKNIEQPLEEAKEIDLLGSKGEENGVSLNQQEFESNGSTSKDVPGISTERMDESDYRSRKDKSEKIQPNFDSFDDASGEAAPDDVVTGSGGAASGSVNGADFYNTSVNDGTVTLTDEAVSVNAPVSVAQDLEVLEEEEVSEVAVSADAKNTDNTRNGLANLGGISGKKKEKTLEALKSDKDAGGRKESISMAESPELSNLFFTVP